MFRSRFSLEDTGRTSIVCELWWGWVTLALKPTAAHYRNTLTRGRRISPDRVGVSVISTGGEVKMNYLVFLLARQIEQSTAEPHTRISTVSFVLSVVELWQSQRGHVDRSL